MKSFEEFKQSLSEKAHTVPKTKKEKDLAALAEPKDKITHADIMKGRGVSEDMHYCAKHVYSERFGEGFVVEGSHAEPNEEGLIEWYDVDFGGTVRRVMTEKVKVMHAEYHMNHKKKKMAEEGDCADGEEMEDDKLEEAKSATHSVYNATVRAEKAGDGPGVKHYVTTHRVVIVARGDDEEKRVKQVVAKHYGDTKHEVTSIVKGQFNRKKPDLNKGIQEAEDRFQNLPGKATHILNKDIRHPEHGIIPQGTVLRSAPYGKGNRYEIRAGRGKGAKIVIDGQHVDELREEVEQIDELSKDTLGSYIKKAVNGVDGIAVRAHLAGQEGDEAQGDKHWKRAVKRGESVAKAVEKLVKSKVNEEATFEKGDFVKDPMGKIHRVFAVNGTTLHTGEYRSNNSYGGNSTSHTSKAKKVEKPAEVNEEVDLVIERLTDDAKKSIQRALGHKLGGNPMRKDSSAARAMIKFAKEHPKNVVQKEDVSMDDYAAAIAGGTTFRDVLGEKKLTPAELKKREEIAQAIERENPGMDMGKKMAIATAQAKKVAEEVEQIDELSKGTLSSYIKKASGEAVQRAHAQTAYQRQADDEPTQPIWREIETLHNTKKWNRMTGIRKAADKLAKEEVEQVDEAKEGKIDPVRRKQLLAKGILQHRQIKLQRKQERDASKAKQSAVKEEQFDENFVNIEEVEQIVEYEIGQAADGKFYDDEGNEVKRIHRANAHHVMGRDYSFGKSRKPVPRTPASSRMKPYKPTTEEVGVSYKDFIDRLNNQE